MQVHFMCTAAVVYKYKKRLRVLGHRLFNSLNFEKVAV